MGSLFYAALGPFRCPKCGRIDRGEFPQEVRRKMAGRTVLWLIPAVALLIVAMVLVFGQ